MLPSAPEPIDAQSAALPPHISPAPAPDRPPPRGRRGGLVASLLVLILVIIAVVGGFGLYLPAPLNQNVTIEIPKGSGLRGIGALLADHEIVHNPWQFILPARLLAARNLRAGEYEFTTGMTVLDIIALLQSGKTVVHRLSIPEGLSSAEIVDLLNHEPALSGTVTAIPPEGSLLPETFYFSRGDDRATILERMQKLHNDTLAGLWSERDSDLPLTSPEAAVILASIVEKETGIAAERPRVAGVFINRLRRGMRLQSDPTVVYGITRGQTPLGRPLSRADLAAATPYNTYVIDGLPPTPIANPGRAALAAVMKPERHDAFYFVADGTGGHAFATTLEEHNRNVARWRALEKMTP